MGDTLRRDGGNIGRGKKIFFLCVTSMDLTYLINQLKLCYKGWIKIAIMRLNRQVSNID